MTRSAVSIAILLTLVSVGCQSEGGAPTANLTLAAPNDPASADPINPTGAIRSILSTWSMLDNAYTADLTKSVTYGADGSFSAAWSPVFKFDASNQALWCNTNTSISGNSSTGTLVVSRARSAVGSQVATDRYCASLVGTWIYQHTASDRLQLCRTDNGACVFWVSP